MFRGVATSRLCLARPQFALHFRRDYRSGMPGTAVMMMVAIDSERT